MSRSSTILRNVASNWVGFAVNAAVTLLLTPLMLTELGEARYGIWILAASIIGYYGMLDLGFRAGVTQYLTRYLALRDYEKCSECISSALAALGALGAVLLLLSVGAAYIGPSVFDISLTVKKEAFWCILIVGFTSATQFAFMPFTSVFTATQRYDLSNLIGVGSRLLMAVGIFLALKMGYGLIGVSSATCAASFVDYVIRWRVARCLVPELEIAKQRVILTRLREIASFGVWNFLISVNTYVYQYVPSILIASLMPIAAVGHYALATGLSRQVDAVLRPVGQVMYPVAAGLHVQGDLSGLKRLYHDGSRLMLLVVIPVVLLTVIWAEDFYRLWIGEKYVSGVPFHSVAFLLQILLIGTFSTYFSNIGGYILIGAGLVRLVAITLIVGSIVNVTLGAVLLKWYGLVGVATSVSAVSLLVDLVVIPVLVQKVLKLPVLDFLRCACMRPFAAGLLQAILLISIRHISRPEDWLMLALQGLLAGSGSIAIAFAVGLKSEERQRLFFTPVRRVWHKNAKAFRARFS